MQQTQVDYDAVDELVADNVDDLHESLEYEDETNDVRAEGLKLERDALRYGPLQHPNRVHIEHQVQQGVCEVANVTRRHPLLQHFAVSRHQGDHHPHREVGALQHDEAKKELFESFSHVLSLQVEGLHDVMDRLGKLDLPIACQHGSLADQEADQTVEDAGTPGAVREQKFSH